VVCIASVVWWQYNPADSLVFDPNGTQEPHSDLDQPSDEPPAEDVTDIPEGAVFSPDQGDKLSLPLEGEILASFGEPFWMFPGMITGGIDGIHIDGTAGDPVHAAWQGVVKEVIPPDAYDCGEVWIEHGSWTTVYKNLEDICVAPGESVEAGQKLGELAGKLYGAYAGDYLEFQLWGPDQVVYDPWEYAGVDR